MPASIHPSPQPGHRTTNLHQFEPTDRPDHFEFDCFSPQLVCSMNQSVYNLYLHCRFVSGGQAVCTSTMKQPGFDGALNVDITECLGLACVFLAAARCNTQIWDDMGKKHWKNNGSTPSKVPDKFGALSAHPLHVDLLCSGHICGEGLPRAALCGRDHHVCL